MHPTLRRIARQAGATLLAVAVIGCAYHGTLRPGFYSPPRAMAKLPLRAALVLGDTLESLEYSENFAWSHSAHIKMHPALKQALTDAAASLFDHVEVVRTAWQGSSADIVLVPTVEVRNEVLYMKLTAKAPESGNTLAEYEASGNVRTGTPPSVTTLAVLNTIFCGLLTPVTTPLATHFLGTAAEETLERRLVSNVRQITEEIGNDRTLVARAKGVPQQPQASLVPERFLGARERSEYRE